MISSVYYYSATQLPPKNFPLVQFSMLEAEDVGLYKFDILAQRGLGKIRDAVEIVRKNRSVEVDIHDVKKIKEDKAVRENLRTANLIGCFYVESPAMRMLLKKLKASTYLDLVAASSIIRPGVAQRNDAWCGFCDFTRAEGSTSILMQEPMRNTGNGILQLCH